MKQERRPKYDVNVVNDALPIRRAAEHFGAEPHRAGSILMCRCVLPDHNDGSPSMALYEDTNHFYCYGCQNGGDPIQLVKLAMGWSAKGDFPKVMELAASLAGVGADIDEATAAEARRRNAEKRKAQQARQDAERRAKEEKAQARWLAARPIEKTDLHYAYLAVERGVELLALDHWPNAVRVYDAFRWNVGDSADDWREFPVICTAMTRGRRITATHLTFLTPEGRLDRRIGQNGRIMLGSPRGAAMHLSRGISGLPPREAFDRFGMADVLALTEGLEDALSVALVMPEWRVWAAYSLDNMANVELPECCGEVVLCAENDTSKGAQAALERVRGKMAARCQGRLLKIARPPSGMKDWNAMHNASGA